MLLPTRSPHPLRHVLRSLFTPTKGRSTSSSRDSIAPFTRRIRLEPLEDRRMLSTLFVDVDAAPGGDGLSWATAFDNLQSGLEAAETLNGDADAGNDIDQIWIAEGTYLPTAQLEDDDVRSASFSLVDSVTLSGGFAGTEMSVGERDLTATNHETILSGDLGGMDDDSDNAYTVVYCGEGVEATVDGVSVVHGRADGTGGSECPERRDGGAIYSRGLLTLTHSVFSDNSSSGAGGAIHSAGGELAIIQSTFSDNTTDGGGGAVYCSKDLLVTQSAFLDNQASGGGGGISCVGSMTLMDTTVSGNSGSRGGGVYAHGPLSVSDSTISGNLAAFGGGVLGDDTVTIVNSTFSDNSATSTHPSYGGGAVFSSGTLMITDSILQNNSAWNHGGGIYGTGTLTVTNCTLAGNSATYGSGGGIYTKDAGPVTVTNSTLIENSAMNLSGGAICSAGNETVTVTDSTLSRNSVTADSSGKSVQGGAIYNASGTMTIANCMISDNSATASESFSDASGGAVYSYATGSPEGIAPLGFPQIRTCSH